MSDATVKLWDAASLARGDADGASLASVSAHKSSIRSLQFNPHPGASQLFASGSDDHNVCVTDMTRLDAPQTGFPAPPETGSHTAPITSVAWNPKVSHILASGGKDGRVIVWDMRNKKPWCQLNDPLQCAVSAVAWNPGEGLQVITASDDDRCPVVRLWDLRSSTTTPLVELSGHQKGILSLSWCQQGESA